MPEPESLSTEYHRAHKQLMLWSAILFIWELIGIDLSKAKDAGGTVGPVVTALKSPQAVPWVLLILVLYFLLKCAIEWAQCHPERRKVRFARVDFISAWVVSIAAIALYVGQAISRVQFANVINGSYRMRSFAVGVLLGMTLGTVVWIHVSPSMRTMFYREKLVGARVAFLFVLTLASSLPLVLLFLTRTVNWRFGLIGLAIPLVWVAIASLLQLFVR
jgi:hypothetical protein